MLRKAIPPEMAMWSFNECINMFRDTAKKTGLDKYNTLADSFTTVGQALGPAGNLRHSADIFSRYSLMGIDFSATSLQVRRVIESALTYHRMQRQLVNGFKQGDVDFALIQDEGLDSNSKANDMVSGSGKINFMTDTVTSQGRAFNFMRITLFQSISQGAQSVMWNNRVFIVMRLPDRVEAQKAVRRLRLPDEFIPVIMNLPDGEAFISAPGLGRARHMKTEFLDLGGYPSDQDVSYTMAAEWKWLEEQSEFGEVPDDSSAMAEYISEIANRHNQPTLPANQEEHPAKAPVTLLSDWAEFLTAVQENPDASSSGFARILTWGAYKSARVARSLIADGLISTTTTSTKGRPSIRYQLTQKGIDSLEAWSAHDNK
jgi:hypothetical protein